MSDTITVLYFYRTKWGAHDEFVALFRKNHWPILREQLASGLVGQLLGRIVVSLEGAI